MSGFVKENFNILIVEDDLIIAEMLKEMFEDLGYCIAGISRNFQGTIALLDSSEKIDLCFLDINLEEQQSGFDIAKAIRERGKLPFVFLTSYSDKKKSVRRFHFSQRRIW